VITPVGLLLRSSNRFRLIAGGAVDIAPAPPVNLKANGGYRKESMLFRVGNLYITPGAVEALAGADPLEYVGRHARGDWGVVCASDKRANEQALKTGARLLSAYRLADGSTRIWIITEADRSTTTVLLPDEY
jgi:hypothetical protein